MINSFLQRYQRGWTVTNSHWFDEYRNRNLHTADTKAWLSNCTGSKEPAFAAATGTVVVVTTYGGPRWEPKGAHEQDPRSRGEAR